MVTHQLKNRYVSEGQHIVHIVQRVCSHNLRYNQAKESIMSLEVRRKSQVICSSHTQNWGLRVKMKNRKKQRLNASL